LVLGIGLLVWRARPESPSNRAFVAFTLGTVTIEADHSKGRVAEDSVIVRGLDEGIEIDPTVRPKIFDPFFTTKPSGADRGLSSCREIADFQRARLALLPRFFLDGGTVAEVEFPSVSLEPSAA